MGEDGERVTLHVYDLSGGMASALSFSMIGKQLDGIWHTGVVVFGKEYFFGGGGGIEWGTPYRTPYGTPVRVVELGTTHIPFEIFQEFLSELSGRFQPHHYHLLKHNCNNFSQELATFLTGTTIPDYISNLPEDAMNSPMGAMLRPWIDGMYSNVRSNAGVGSNLFVPNVSVPPPTLPPKVSPSQTVATPVRESPLTPQMVQFANGKVEGIAKKLAEFEAEVGATDGEEGGQLAAFVSTNEGKSDDSSKAPAAVAEFIRLVTYMPDDKLFPAVDLFRLGLSRSKEFRTLAGENEELRECLKKRLLETCSSNEATVMMTMRLVCNMLFYDVKLPCSHESLVELITISVEKNDFKQSNSFKIAVVSLVLNLLLSDKDKKLDRSAIDRCVKIVNNFAKEATGMLQTRVAAVTSLTTR